MCASPFGQDDPTAPAPDATPAPSFWDSINPFSSSTPATPAAPVASPAAAAPDPSDQYSKYYTLGDLTVTSQPFPNLPLDQITQDNLKKLGVTLDAIRDNVGTFTIASAYRSQANQNNIRAGGSGAAAATMAVSHSYHTMGLAADITPTNGMSPTAFAQAIYNNPLFKVLIGQLVDKSEGGSETSLHITTTIPTCPSITPFYVGSGGAYMRMSPKQIGDWLQSTQNVLSMPSVDNSIPVSDDQNTPDDSDIMDPSSTPWGTIGIALAVLAGAGYFFYAKKKRT